MLKMFGKFNSTAKSLVVLQARKYQANEPEL